MSKHILLIIAATFLFSNELSGQVFYSDIHKRVFVCPDKVKDLDYDMYEKSIDSINAALDKLQQNKAESQNSTELNYQSESLTEILSYWQTSKSAYLKATDVEENKLPKHNSITYTIATRTPEVMRVNHTTIDTLSKEKSKWIKCGHRQATCLSKDPNDCFILNLGNRTVVDSYGKPIPLDILSSQFDVLDFDKKNYTTVMATLYW